MQIFDPQQIKKSINITKDFEEVINSINLRFFDINKAVLVIILYN